MRAADRTYTAAVTADNVLRLAVTDSAAQEGCVAVLEGDASGENMSVKLSDKEGSVNGNG